jgi:serine/threonine protein phosphatase PrpC
MLVKFNAKAQGKSHGDKNIPCQDDADSCLGSNNTVGMAFVADGHGGAKYTRSQDGSSIAVRVAEKALSTFYGTIKKQGEAFFNQKAEEEQRDQEIQGHLKRLEENIIYQWRNMVKVDIKNRPLTDEEKEICKASNIDSEDDESLVILYGATLLAALVSDSFWFAIQIGDGLCVTLQKDGIAELTAKMPIPGDERLAFGRTTSLCDTEAIKNFRESFGLAKIRGITVATDGVVDSFEQDKYLQFNRELYEKFKQYSHEKVKEDLQAFLPELSRRGSGDDVAIAGIFRMET